MIVFGVTSGCARCDLGERLGGGEVVGGEFLIAMAERRGTLVSIATAERRGTLD